MFKDAFENIPPLTTAGVAAPWWSKIVAKLVLSRLPFDYSLWQHFGLFRHGKMDQFSHAYRVFRNHVEHSGLTNQLNGRTVLEIGPGDSILTALIAASCHAKSFLVDAGDYAICDVDFYKKSADDLVRLGLHPPDLSRAQSRDEVLALCGARYFTSGLKSLTLIESNSIDLIFSHVVLEHIRLDEFPMMMSECHRVLKQNGVASHVIDYRDHLEGGLNNLRFSERIWESNFFANSGFYTNRLRHHEVLFLMTKSGFDVEVVETSAWNKVPISRHLLSSNFSSMSDEQLMINESHILLRPK